MQSDADSFAPRLRRTFAKPAAEPCPSFFRCRPAQYRIALTFNPCASQYEGVDWPLSRHAAR